MLKLFRRFYRAGFLTRFTLPGLIYYLKLRLQNRKIVRVGSCLQCGNCCRSICLEDSSGWLTSEKKFNKILDELPEYSRFEICGRDRAGYLLFTCSWCNEEGHCSDYDNRLTLCRKYPETSLTFAGGTIPEHCGYRLVETADFQRLLKKEIGKRNEKNIGN